MHPFSRRSCSSSACPSILAASFAASFAALLLTGCANLVSFPDSAPITSAVSGATLQGTVHGGQGPIVGAHIYLFQASQGAYAGNAQDLLTVDKTITSDSLGPYVTTGPTGSWSVSGDYAGCTPGAVVYVLSTQGNPGLSNPNANNAAIALMAVLGPCPSADNFSSAPPIDIDELTTVAGAYALSGFMTGPTNLGSPSSTVALTAIANASANAGYLVNISTGAVPPNSTRTLPQSELNTLGNILAYCVNSDGASNCTSLFDLAPSSASTVPTDTLTAMLNIVHNPGANANPLWSLVGTKGDPFQPSLSSAPNDWSVEITYSTANAKDLPSGQARIALDASGNLYIPHNYGVQQISPGGTVLATNDNNLGGYYAAVSPSDGSVWTAGQGLYFNSSAVNDSTTNYSGGEASVAFDKSGNAWSGNQGPASIGEFTGITADVTTAIRAGGLQQNGGGIEGNGIAIDSNGNIWTLWRDNSLAAEITPSGNGVSPAGGATASTLYYPTSLAIDASNNAWMIGENGLVTVFNSSAALVSGAGYPTGGTYLTDPQDIAIDGSGTVWISSGDGQALYSLNASGTLTSPANGYAAVTEYPSLLAIDSAGNIWVTDANTATLGEFIGLATPVVTPITPGALATRP
jgi:hypothetical protein